MLGIILGIIFVLIIAAAAEQSWKKRIAAGVAEGIRQSRASTVRRDARKGAPGMAKFLRTVMVLAVLAGVAYYFLVKNGTVQPPW